MSEENAGNLLRSEEMSLVQLYVPMEISQPTVAELGELGLVQFRDLNPDVNPFQRVFVTELRRMDEIERRILYLNPQIKKEEIATTNVDSGNLYYSRSRSPHEIDEMDQKLIEYENRILHLNSNIEVMNRKYLQLVELRHVIKETSTVFNSTSSSAAAAAASSASLLNANGSFREDTSLLGVEEEEGFQSRLLELSFVAGVIPREKFATFERILFRALRGNLYMNKAELPEKIVDPETDEEIFKDVFVIFAHGNELLTKIRKICESMDATIYAVDSDPQKRMVAANDVEIRITDLTSVLNSTRLAKRADLSQLSEIIETWEVVVKKEKAMYHTLNLFSYDANRKAMIAEGWVPTLSIPTVQFALNAVSERTMSQIPPILHEIPTKLTPPTYMRTNKFTDGFQNIVDAYGIASYREVNPGIFTVTTFPFLFAVMFGDIGHGILMTATAAYIVWKERQLATVKQEIFETFFSGRYIILLMGIFSIYTGLIYNDMFSKPLDLFGSGWKFEQVGSKWVGEHTHTYIIGVDPAWHGSDNSLLYGNSYKMKMSIIFGVVHMSLGIFMNVINFIHFKQKPFIILEFVPQIVFLLSIFGYLVILILYKWATPWPDPGAAPGLLNTLIYMFLSPGSIDESNKLFAGQGLIQGLLFLIAMLCVPWMLLGKPLYLKREHKKRVGAGYANLDDNVDDDALLEGSNEDLNQEDSGVGTSHEHGGSEFEFGEVMMHQVIHTIEFCLGAISNTASYLRLWALSLAHAQLSQVLWNMILNNVLKMEGPVAPVAIFIGFSFWFVLTIIILLLMEGLSAFLHALRLHWVEFMNKFYGGQGTKFEPFSFEAILSEKEE